MSGDSWNALANRDVSFLNVPLKSHRDMIHFHGYEGQLVDTSLERMHERKRAKQASPD
jgi:hypothetical protein